jgi:thiamine pyrophosphate-dependent acetolactate synthase large subunit-like protein
MYVYEAIGEILHNAGVEHVFGLMGDGNLRFVRATGRVGVCTVTQGPGVTNTLTAVTGARDARSPVLILAGDTPTSLPTNYQAIDQAAVFEIAGAGVQPVRAAKTAPEDIDRAIRRALQERRPVAVNLTIKTQDSVSRPVSDTPMHAPTQQIVPSATAISEVAELLSYASRPVILGGLGAAISGAGPALRELAAQTGALLATTVRGRGLFTGDEYDLGICGDLSTGLTSQLIHRADVIFAVGASLNFWTTCSGELIPPDKLIIHCDADPSSIGRNTPVTYGIVGDATLTAELLLEELQRNDSKPAVGYRVPDVQSKLNSFHPADELTEVKSDSAVDPRFLMLALDRMLPEGRTISIDGGHFAGFPAAYLTAPDPSSFLFAVNFGSIGLSLGTGLGAAVARPDRLSVVVIGDGALMMSLGDLDTAVRYNLPILIVVMNDAAYGAEVHTLDLLGLPEAEGHFNDADFAAIGTALGAQAITVRSVDDLEQLRPWLNSPTGPMVVDAKINPAVRAPWIEDVIRLQIKARNRVRGTAPAPAGTKPAQQ